ncbi:MAG: RNA polymerase sigma factor [Phycisphaeraceae bacterium]
MTETVEMLSDARLMAGLSRGDMRCLGELVTRHQQAARRLAYRWLGSWDDAEDVAQDAFVRVLNAAGRYQPTANFTTWLYRIVVNLCMDQKRKRGRRGAVALMPGMDAADAAGGAADALAQREQAERVRQAIGSLPERQRMAVILLRYEGLTYRQIAEAMETTETAVDSLLSRAWATLRRELADVSASGEIHH